MIRRTFRWLTLGLLLGALTACAATAEGEGPGGPTTAQSPGSAPTDAGEPIRVLTTNLLSHAPLFIAEDAGLLDEAGLEVEVVAGQRAPELVPLLERGELDVWSGSPTPALYALIDAGIPIRIVADKGHVNRDCAYWSFVARREATAAEGWGTADGMRELRVGRPAAASTPNFYTDVVLGALDLTQEDVTMVDLPFPAAAEAVATGQADLGMVVEPQLTQALRDPDLVMWRPSHETVAGMQAAVIVFGPRLVEEDRELGERFMEVYLEAVRRYNEGPTESNLRILAERTGIPSDVLEDACWPAIRADGQVDLESLVASQEWAVGRDMQDAVVPPQSFWDGRFVEAVSGDAG